MANITVLNGSSDSKSMKTSGAGTDADPHVPYNRPLRALTATDLTIEVAAQAAGEVLFDTTPIALADQNTDPGEIIAITMAFLTNAAFDFDLYILNTSTSIGTAGAAPTISASDLQPLIVADFQSKIAGMTNPIAGLYVVTLPLMGIAYQAKTAEKNIHIAAITRSAHTPSDATVKSYIAGIS